MNTLWSHLSGHTRAGKAGAGLDHLRVVQPAVLVATRPQFTIPGQRRGDLSTKASPTACLIIGVIPELYWGDSVPC